jgi:predicted DNA-binding antitoxin AbrB/MazE fold protein
MIQHVNAIYDGGVLKPLTPLDLNDRELVVLSIEKIAPDTNEPSAAEPTLYEILDEVGLIGCIENAPADLSTNPKYMEGFGKSGD